MPSYSPTNSSAVATHRAAGAPAVRPSGDVAASLTAGRPAESVPAGTYQVETHILVMFTTPRLDRAAFPGRLDQTVHELIPGNAGTTPSMTSVAASTGNGGTWFTIRFVLTAPTGATLANLNRAIARAFANTVDLSSATNASHVVQALDGSQLLRMLSRPDACTGATASDQVYARACTRWVPYAGAQMTPVAPPPGSSNAPPAPKPSIVTSTPATTTTTPPAPTTRPTTGGGNGLAVPDNRQTITPRVVPNNTIIVAPVQRGTPWGLIALGSVVAVAAVVAVVKRKEIAAYFDKSGDDSDKGEE